MAATRQTTLAARLQARTLHPGLAALFGAPWASFGVGAAPRSTLFLARMLVRAFRMVYAVPPMGGRGPKYLEKQVFLFLQLLFLGSGVRRCARLRARRASGSGEALGPTRHAAALAPLVTPLPRLLVPREQGG